MSGSKYEQLIHKIDEKKAALEKLPPDTSDKSFEEWRDQVLRQALPNSNYLGEFEALTFASFPDRIDPGDPFPDLADSRKRRFCEDRDKAKKLLCRIIAELKTK